MATAESHPAALQSASEPAEEATAVRFAITHVEETQPQYIRIFNLPEGTRMILLLPAPQFTSELFQPSNAAGDDREAPRIIRIFNVLDEGAREIALPPAP